MVAVRNIIFDITMKTLDKSIVIYLIISCLAIIYNLLTLHNFAPWLDEVMIVDSSAQFFLHGEWDSTAFWGSASIYVPLYGILQLIWYYVFGFSFLSARLMNIFLYVFVGLSLMSFLKKLTGKRMSVFAAIFFSGILWFTADISNLYREGRPDILCALFSILIVKEAYNYIINKHTKPYKLVIYGVLLFMSGLQACMCIAAMFVYFLIWFWKEKVQITKAFLFFLCGCIIGLFLTAAFMYYTGVFNTFVINTLHQSSTLWKLFLFVAPLFTTKQFGDFSEVKIDFIDKLSESFSSPMVWVLFGGGVLLLMYCLYRNKNKSTVILFILPVFIVVAMNASGRYYGHYCWMFFLPQLFYLTYILMKMSSKSPAIVGCLTLLATCVISQPSFGDINDKAYKNMSDFVNRQNFKLTDKVATPMAVFYELKPHIKDIFFPEICPLKSIPRLDYIIVPTYNAKSDKFMNYYSSGIPKMNECFQNIANDTTIVLQVLDSCKYPSVQLYKIQRKQ